MDWQNILNFIKLRDPKLLEDFKGVPIEDIRKVEKSRKIKLPQLYVDFLLTMGQDSGKLFPKGHYSYDWQEVLDTDPVVDYPRDKYFKIAFATHEDVVPPPDYYLDLSRSDGTDAPIEASESGSEFAVDANLRGDTFGDWIARSVYNYFELVPKKHKRLISIYSATEAERVANEKSITDELARRGFTNSDLKSTKNYTFLNHENITIMIQPRVVWIVSDQQKPVDELAKWILTIPGAKDLYPR